MHKKKIATIILAASMTTPLSGCYTAMPITADTKTESTNVSAKTENTDSTEEAVDISSSEDEEKANELFQQAQEESDCFADGTYTKVMFCKAESVSNESDLAKDAKGIDYVFICRHAPNDAEEDATETGEDIAETYAVVVVSAYTDGTLRGAYVLHSDVETYLEDTEDMPGAWINLTDNEISEDFMSVLKSAFADYPEYTISGLLSTQVVSGTNCRLFCVYNEDGEEKYAIATVYVDLEDNAELTELVSVSDGVDLLAQNR